MIRHFVIATLVAAATVLLFDLVSAQGGESAPGSSNPAPTTSRRQTTPRRPPPPRRQTTTRTRTQSSRTPARTTTPRTRTSAGTARGQGEKGQEGSQQQQEVIVNLDVSQPSAQQEAINCRATRCAAEFAERQIRSTGIVEGSSASTWTRTRRSREQAVCNTFGEPHALSFDNRMSTYQGTCRQILLRVNNARVPGLTPFTVYTKNRQHRTRRETVPLYAEVHTLGQQIHLGSGGVLRVSQYSNQTDDSLTAPNEVNGRDAATPYMFPESEDCNTPCQILVEGEILSQSSIQRRRVNPNLRITLRTEYGLSVSMKGDGVSDGAININPPVAALGQTSGICGIWNNRTDDDWMMPNGRQAPNEQMFASSWQVRDLEDPSCVPAQSVAADRPCPPQQQQIADRTCALILDKTNVFGPCLANEELRLAAQLFHQACIFDICQTTDTDFAISAMEEFSERCQELLPMDVGVDYQTALRTLLGVAVATSGDGTGPRSCPVQGMNFLDNAKRTPTCENPILVLVNDGSVPNGGHCVCPDNQVFNRETRTCMNADQCGCRDTSGATHRVGSTWMSKDCSRMRTCRADRTISDAEFQCPAEQLCGRREGASICACPLGSQMTNNVCVDIDECALQQNLCGANANCINVPGSYECVCHDGFQKHGDNGACVSPAEAGVPAAPGVQQNCQREEFKAVARVCAGLLLDPAGPLRICLVNDQLTAGVRAAYRACIAERCNGHAAMLRLGYSSVDAFARTCQAVVGQAAANLEWRSLVQSIEQRNSYQKRQVLVETKQCPPLMAFNPQANATPTCEDQNLDLAAAGVATSGACVCNDGLLYHPVSASCVPATSCGCQDESGLHRSGQVWLGAGCTTRRVCNSDFTIATAAYQCPAGQACTAGPLGGNICSGVAGPAPLAVPAPAAAAQAAVPVASQQPVAN